MAGRPRPRVVALLLFAGVLLAQAAWLVSVPAFRGLDEFDHAFRAASVARGELLPSGVDATHGRGELVRVPRDLVQAAGPECRPRSGTGPDNCDGVRRVGRDDMEVASAASRYHPAYYWVVGTAARWFHGTAALYAMRIASALLFAGFVALAGWATSRWARTRWPMVALLGCLTPVVLYSGMVVAPNALEIGAALSVWAALAGLVRAPDDPRLERTLLWAAVPGAVVLATVRSLGIGWLVLCVLVVAATAGWRRTAEVARRNRGTLAGVAALVGLAVVAALAWLLSQKPNQVGGSSADNPGVVVGSLIQLPVWVLQSIAAAPGRVDPAPPVAYLLCGAGLLALLVTGFRQASAGLRRSLLVIAVIALALPLALTLDTYREVGVIWQGRYGLPLVVGLLVLTGLALDEPRPARQHEPLVVGLGLAAFAVGQVVEVLHVLDSQRRVSPSIALGLWHPPADWLVALVMLGGWALLVASSVLGPSRAVAVDELARELLEEQSHVGDDAARL